MTSQDIYNNVMSQLSSNPRAAATVKVSNPIRAKENLERWLKRRGIVRWQVRTEAGRGLVVRLL